MILGSMVASSTSDQVKRLIEKLEYTLSEFMSLLDLSRRATFQKNYLNPALDAGPIERTLPFKLKSPKQKYKLKK